ncbi:MAG: hypothetical protein VW450_08425 [Chloroflexota bacterium]
MPRPHIQLFDVVRYGWVLAVIVVFTLVYSGSCQRIPVLDLAGAEASGASWQAVEDTQARAGAAALLAAGDGLGAVRAGVEAVRVSLHITLSNPSDGLTASVSEVSPGVRLDDAPVPGADFAPFIGISLSKNQTASFGLTLLLPVADLPDGVLAALASGGTAALVARLQLSVNVNSLVNSQLLVLPPLTVGPMPSLAGAVAP